MEEDIKILKELKEDETLDCSGIYKRLSEREQQAIENILNRLEQLEKELEPIRELGIPVKTVVAELNRLEDLEDDRVQMQMIINELRKDSIPKSVIREKIEECKKDAHKFYEKKGISTGCKFCNNTCNWYSRCKLLEELLGEEK